jgi:hypothetical protein
MILLSDLLPGGCVQYFGPWRPFSPSPRAAADLRAAALTGDDWPQPQGPKEIRAALPANPFYMEGTERSFRLDQSKACLSERHGFWCNQWRGSVVFGMLISENKKAQAYQAMLNLVSNDLSRSEWSPQMSASVSLVLYVNLSVIGLLVLAYVQMSLI